MAEVILCQCCSFPKTFSGCCRDKNQWLLIFSDSHFNHCSANVLFYSKQWGPSVFNICLPYCISGKFVFFFKFYLLPMLRGAIVLANRQLLLEVLKKIVHKTVLVVLVLGANKTNSGHKTFSDIFKSNFNGHFFLSLIKEI